MKSPLTIRVVAIADLTSEALARWRQLQACSPELQSPFFAPEFALTFGAAGRAVEVGLIEIGDALVGIFPFERGSLSRSRLSDRLMATMGASCPVGRRLSDSHGLISKPEVCISSDFLLRKCGLTTWDFHRLPASQSTFAPSATGQLEWSIIDLRDGHAA